jgi:hypothetical protein
MRTSGLKGHRMILAIARWWEVPPPQRKALPHVALEYVAGFLKPG